MFVSRIFPAAFALTMSVAAIAQKAPAPAPAPPAGAQSMMPGDCANAMPGHDHDAGKGARKSMSSMPMSGMCDAAPAAQGAKAKAKRGHDHARVHKLM